MNNLKRSYYKLRIVFSFTIISALIIITLSRVSYNFVKNIYLEQIGEQAVETARLISARIDSEYLQLLEIGPPSVSVQKYFNSALGLGVDKNKEVFLFDEGLNVLFHSLEKNKFYISDARLAVYEAEIKKLKLNAVISTQPFHGDDKNWYLWAFSRITENYYLAFKEDAGRLARVEEFSLWSWLIGAGLVILIIIISKLLADSITKPVDKLVKFSLQIGKEDKEISIPAGMKGELKLLSDAMGAMQKGLLANHKEKENMLAQIAHEIRNPLGGIELLASLVKEELKPGEKNNEYLGKILDEVNRLKFLITAFLDYSKPVKPVLENVELNEYKDYLNLNFNSSLAKKNIKLEFELNEEKFFFDKEHLRQILVNLVSNSIDAVSTGGKIIISSKKNRNKCQLKVTDNGPGINFAESSNLFKPFYTTKKNGTGLGLAVCKKLAAENEAEIIFAGQNGFSVIVEKYI